MKFSNFPALLKAAQAERKAKAEDYRKAREAFNSETAKLRSMIERRDSLVELAQRARDEAQKSRARVRTETSAYLDGNAAPNGIGAASRAQKEAEAQATDLALALEEASAPIEAQRQVALSACESLRSAHRQASVMFATCEVLSAAIETFPILRRAQRIALACDAVSELALLVRGLAIPPDAWECDDADDKLTDGLGSPHAITNHKHAIERIGVAA